MAQNEVQSVIVIGGRVDNTFNALGDKLIQMGYMVSNVSRQIIDIGKESVNVYMNYEKEMAEAEVAMSRVYGQGTELQNVMADLDVAARYWAQNSIFHTNDVAHAIATAAHAGLEYEQVMDVMPAAMHLAQAGGIELSEAFSMLNDSMKAMGLDYSYAETFTDQWTFAANSVNTDIEGMGKALLRLSSTAMFGGDSAEVLTMLGILAERGVKGSEAGTLLRNSMIRLVAPTAKAQKALAGIGATQDEVDAAMEMGEEEFAALAEAVEAMGGTVRDKKGDLLDTYKIFAEMQRVLGDNGFSAFDDSTGQLRSFMDIWSDLHAALQSMFGEDYMTNKYADALLSSIFPTRTITGALALLSGFGSEAAQTLYEGVLNGSEGYGAYGAGVLNDTLFGSTELFKSKWENLEASIGQYLKTPLEEVYEIAGNVMDKITELPEDKFNAIVAGLGTFAGMGLGLTGTGIAFKMLGTILTPTGATVMGILAATSAMAALGEKSKVDLQLSFGTMKTDVDEVTGYIGTLGAAFDEAHADIYYYKSALDEAISSYESASSTFSSKLFTSMLTGATLTGEEILSIQDLGRQMYDAVQDGIENGLATTMSFWDALFAGESPDTLADINSVLYGEYLSLKAEAAKIGNEINDAFNDAISNDGKVDPAEYDKIKAYMEEYNRIMAEAAREVANDQDETQLEIWMHKAQTASYDDIKAMSDEAVTQRDKRMAELEEEYEKARAQTVVAYRKEGYTDEQIDNILKYGKDGEGGDEGVEEIYARRRQELRQKYDEFIIKLWGQTLTESDYWDDIERINEKGKSTVKDWGTTGIGIQRLAADVLSTGISPETLDLNDENSKVFYETMRAGSILNPHVSMMDPLSELQSKIDSAQEYANGHPLLIPAEVEVNWSETYSIFGNSEEGNTNDPVFRQDFGKPYAEGGRADRPSIFGEAGAEWAIPEQHTADTARLLMQAAAASGFTWSELAGASGDTSGYTLVYSPTIYAQDASGVEDKLIADKARLKKYLAENKMREKAEVYS